MKEEQKIFNYDTLWDNLLKGWCYELYYYYHKYLDNPDYLSIKENLYNKYVEFEKIIFDKFGYQVIGEFLKYCVDDLDNITDELNEDDDLNNILNDYIDLYYNYVDLYLLFQNINEVDFYDIYYSV